MNHFKHTLGNIQKHRKLFVAATLVDVLFVFLYGVIMVPLFNLISEKVVKFGMVSAQYGPRLADFSTTLLQAVLEQPDLKIAATNVVFYILVTMGVFYLFYVLFQGFSWWLCHRMFKKVSFKNFMGVFAKVSLIWLLLLIIYKAIEFVVVYAQYFQLSEMYWISYVIMLVYLIVWLYFAFLSYSHILLKNPVKRAFSRGVQKRTLKAVGLLGGAVCCIDVIIVGGILSKRRCFYFAGDTFIFSICEFC